MWLHMYLLVQLAQRHQHYPEHQYHLRVQLRHRFLRLLRLLSALLRYYLNLLALLRLARPLVQLVLLRRYLRP